MNLLRILAAESGKNIVIGDDVKGKMSISLPQRPLGAGPRHDPRDARAPQGREGRRAPHRLDRAAHQGARGRRRASKRRGCKAETDVAHEDGRGPAQGSRRRSTEKRPPRRRWPRREARGPAARGDDPALLRRSRGGRRDAAGHPRHPAGGPGPDRRPARSAACRRSSPGPPFSALYGHRPQPAAAAAVSVSPADVLAKGITIRAHKPTNTIFIRHYEADLERIKKLIRESSTSRCRR